jgi:hypothetical protein
MEKEFVPYELSLELKQLGFDEPCFGWFTGSYLRIGSVVENKHVQGEDEILAPTYSQAFRWFEEKYSYFVDIRTDTTPNEILGFDYYIKSWKFGQRYLDFVKDKREGNIEVIKKMIEMVKKEKQKEILIDLMNMDDGETKTHLSVGEKMIKMVRDAKQKSINKKNK